MLVLSIWETTKIVYFKVSQLGHITQLYFSPLKSTSEIFIITYTKVILKE